MSSGFLVLLADNNRLDQTKTAELLRGQGFQTSTADDGMGALRKFFGLHPDVIVVDVSVRNPSAWDTIERIREVGDTPIIVTSPNVDPDAMSRALRLGADSFLMKPLDDGELLLRIRTISEAHKAPDLSQWVYRHNGLTIDRRSCEVTVNGNVVDLTGTEYRLLSYLVERRGWVVSHDQILDNVWGPNHDGDRARVKLYMWYLRRKLEEDTRHPKLIKTKRGLGYRFVG
jgi:DNA-binding response OmpR family regulator